MVKNYYKWVPEKTVGIITSPDGQVIYDEKGENVFTPSLNEVGVWNLRKSEQVKFNILILGKSFKNFIKKTSEYYSFM